MTGFILIAHTLTGINFLLGFEFKVVREFEDMHYGWYCSISIHEGDGLKISKDRYFYSEQFENIFLSSEEMDEIKNRINYLLETEDEENEKNGDKTYELDNIPSGGSDST